MTRSQWTTLPQIFLFRKVEIETTSACVLCIADQTAWLHYDFCSLGKRFKDDLLAFCTWSIVVGVHRKWNNRSRKTISERQNFTFPTRNQVTSTYHDNSNTDPEVTDEIEFDHWPCSAVVTVFRERTGRLYQPRVVVHRKSLSRYHGWFSRKTRTLIAFDAYWESSGICCFLFIYSHCQWKLLLKVVAALYSSWRATYPLVN